MMVMKYFSKQSVTTLLVISSMATPNSAMAYRQHWAHVHGYVIYNIAQDQDNLLIDIHASGIDVVGFEHKVSNKKENEIFNKTTRLLKASRAILYINPQAGCQQTIGAVDIDNIQATLKQNSKINNPFVDHSSHSNFTITYQFKCSTPQYLRSIQTSWFEHFPSTKLITVNYLTDRNQNATELTRKNTTVHFKS